MGLHAVNRQMWTPSDDPPVAIVNCKYQERLWPLMNEAIANRSFANLEQLERATLHRCQVLLERRELIHGLTNFYWWQEAVS